MLQFNQLNQLNQLNQHYNYRHLYIPLTYKNIKFLYGEILGSLDEKMSIFNLTKLEFLIWTLKKCNCDNYLVQMILEMSLKWYQQPINQGGILETISYMYCNKRIFVPSLTIYRRFYNNRQIEEERYFERGFSRGSHRLWYPNGSSRKEGVYDENFHYHLLKS